FPFFWILISSFKPESEIFGANAYRIIAENPTLENYRTVIVEKGMLRAIGNSFVMSAATTFYVVIVASMSAYIISRFKFKGKALLMGLILAVAMFPQISL
ncbi:MAG: carbohydrate ABC transporter permease, partial [Blautia coccoides]